jgi:hypothetical protein
MQECQILGIVDGEPHQADTIINQWLAEGWELFSVFQAKAPAKKSPQLITVVLVREKQVTS